jgi:hypothetical protein
MEVLTVEVSVFEAIAIGVPRVAHKRGMHGGLGAGIRSKTCKQKWRFFYNKMGGSVVVEVLLGCWRASYRSVKAKKIQLSSVPKLVFGSIYAV